MNKIFFVVDCLSLFELLLMFLLVGIANSYSGNMVYGNRGVQHSVSHKYDRIDEVSKECAFVIDSATELKLDDSRLYNMKEEMTFVYGDWNQELKGVGAPIMPYKDLDESRSRQTHVVSFWLTDVSGHHHVKNSISVSGLLRMGITAVNLGSEDPRNELSPEFVSWPGKSEISVSFQGIYVESQRKNQERVLCLLGNAMLPSRQPDAADPWGRKNESNFVDMPLLARDDQILLVLRYPRVLTLTSRLIVGSMKSLNPQTSRKYFDEIQIFSMLSTSSTYEFMGDNLVSRACDPYPFKDSLSNGEIEMYKDIDFCAALERHSNGEELSILPNWNCNDTDEFCAKFGPFMFDKEINATNGSFKDVKLVLQDIRCENSASHDDAGSAKVSLVLRAFTTDDNQYIMPRRTVIDNKTLSAEGIWKASSGQLCMVGCLGPVDENGGGCDSRLCLYIPLSFSLKQRSVLSGTLSSIDTTSGSRLYFPLEFGKLVRPHELLNQYTISHPYYKYSKIDSAGVVLEKQEPFNFGTVIMKSLLKFPKPENNNIFPSNLSPLFEDLTLNIYAVSDPISDSFITGTLVAMDILSVGPKFGGIWFPDPTIVKENHYHDVTTEKQLLVNVSCQLSLSVGLFGNFSELSVEGIYNPLVGKMYLIGCRHVQAPWKILHESMDLEAGLDCLVELVISYPPTTSRWLVDPTARISVTSQRNEDDPLYFIPIKLQTVPLMYSKQREDILSRRGVEGMLRILTLSVAILFIISQLLYIRDNTDSTPYISLVALGIQALGYSIPLITDAEALFKKAQSEFNGTQAYNLQNSQWISVINYSVKFLVLVAFSLTLRVCQKVWRSRVRMLTRAPLEPHRVPCEKKVFSTTIVIHAIGYAVVLIAHCVRTSKTPLQTSEFSDSNGYPQTIHEWKIVLEEYLGLVQDFFLLPQVISNLVWRIHCRPLRKTYYVGITIIRLLPHLYDYTKSPIPNPYFVQQYAFVDPVMNFYSDFGDIAIPIFAILLALAIYVQQRWSYSKLSQKLVVGQSKLLPLGSKVYERLPSMSFEAELVSDVYGNHTSDKPHDSE